MFCVGDLRFFSACATLLQGLGFLKRTLRFCGRSCFWRRSAASVEGNAPLLQSMTPFRLMPLLKGATLLLLEEKYFAFRGDGLFFEAFCFFCIAIPSPRCLRFLPRLRFGFPSSMLYFMCGGGVLCFSVFGGFSCRVLKTVKNLLRRRKKHDIIGAKKENSLF